MMDKLVKLIVDPEDHGELQISADGGALVNPRNNNVYDIIDNVPIILSKRSLEEFTTSSQHSVYDTRFYYVDHYIKDAEEFDYFEVPTHGPMIHENIRLHQAIINKIPKKSKMVLDAGCGNAWLAKAFLNTDKIVISFDIAKNNTIRALKEYPADNHHAITGDVFKLPFRKNLFDTVVSAEVIEHIPNIEGYIESLLSVTKDGGNIIISTPYNNSPWRFMLPFYRNW